MPILELDDGRHALLRKARPLAQSNLDGFVRQQARVPPRDAFGPYTVKEVEVQSALTVCRLPGEPWSLNPYTGCSHACAYCYVPDVIKVQRENWGTYVLVKTNLPILLARELRRKERKEVFLSSATDPYQPAEHAHRITRKALELLARHDWPVTVLTRSPLVRRDIDLFQRFSEIEVGLSIPTLDDEARRLIEPHAPPVEGRLAALRDLSDAGLATFANFMPTYPLTGGWEAEAVADAFAATGVRHVYAGRWGYLPNVVPVLRDRLRSTRFEPFLGAVRDPYFYDLLFRRLALAFAKRGLAFTHD